MATTDIGPSLTTAEPRDEDNTSLAYTVCVSIFLILVILTIAAGNILTVVAYVKFPSHWTSSEAANIYLINVAVADLMVAFTLMPLQFLYLPLFDVDIDNRSGCMFKIGMGCLSLGGSSYFLAMATLDKHVAIHWPNHHTRFFNRFGAIVGSVITWMILVVASIMSVSLWNEWDSHPHCVAPRVMNIQWMDTAFCIDVLVSLFMCFCNISMLVTARKQARRIFNLTSQVAANQTRSNKATKVVSIVVIVYMTCRLPMTIMLLVSAVWKTRGWEITDQLAETYNAALLITFVNSAMNPVIYCLTMSSVRAAFRKVLHL